MIYASNLHATRFAHLNPHFVELLKIPLGPCIGVVKSQRSSTAEIEEASQSGATNALGDYREWPP